MNINISLSVLSISFCLLACRQNNDSSQFSGGQESSQYKALYQQLDSIAQTDVLPGFAVSVFNADTIYFKNGFGYSDLEDEKAFTADNIQIIASLTKTLVGVALMKAVEEGELSLDDHISNILPYEVVNPNFPNDKITIRMLASHTSSISDSKNSDKGYRFETPLDSADFPEAYHTLLENYNKKDKILMSDFIQEKLDAKKGGYDKEMFINEQPGTFYEYSNTGIALLAHIIEIKTGKSFDKYTEGLILQALEMKSSHWRLDKVPASKQVSYYNELKNELPKYYIITYPDGGLYSSVTDMTLFLQEMIKGYDGKSQILSKQSFHEMMKKQFLGEDLDDGICWDLSFEGLIGHSGNDFGTATLMYFSPETGIGRILFTNISIETEEQEEAFYGIFNLLFEYEF
ncbi:MAG: serine hydrolase domain-containing protein [Bacteroidota bacterium]